MSRPRLQTIIVEVTQACNHACRHCYNFWNAPNWQGARLGNSSDLRPLLAHVLDQVECSHVTLTGGEPLLSDDLPDIVSFLNQRGAAINLISNGHLLTDSKTAELIECGVSLFELPLLSFRRTVHDELSGSPGAFDAVLQAIANIRHYQGQVVTAFVATRRNIHHLSDTLKLAFAFGVNGVMINRFNPGGRGINHIEELLPTIVEMREALQIAETATLEYRLPISCSIPIQPCLIDITAFPHLGFGFCAAGSERAYYTLDTEGNVRPCNHTPTIIGNVWRDSFENIIDQFQKSDFVAAVPTHCETCPQRNECQGGCKAAAQVCYGDLRAEEPFLRRRKR